MRKLTLLFLLIAHTGLVIAQVTSLNENFNSSCPSGTHGPYGWTVYSITISITGEDQWTCDAAFGRGNTPGISCSGFYGTPATNHIDTSFFISPELDLSSYTGNVYLNYDTKCTRIVLGGKLDVIASNNAQLTDNNPDTTAYLEGTPVFGTPDSTDWVTHQVDLTAYKNFPHLFVGFRYACTTGTATASRWYLDNIHTTTQPLSVGTLGNYLSSFSVIGISTADEISISCSMQSAGPYYICIYDITGREVHKEQVQLPSGRSLLTLHTPHLAEGMYMIKLSNEEGYSVTRVQVR